MRATQELKYAVYGIFDLAYNGGSEPVSLHEIGARQEIPTRYLEQIFQKLRRGGLVKSKRGPGGGYVLARSPDEISLADVLCAVQGDVLARTPEPGECAAESPSFVWDLLRDGLQETLRARSIADLCREAGERGIAHTRSEPVMYEI